MDDESGGIFDRVQDFQFKILSGNGSGVANLTAGFGIKRRTCGDDFNFLPFKRFGDLFTVGHHNKYFRIAAQGIVAHKLRLDTLGRQVFVSLTDTVKGGHRPGSGTLGVHGLVEPVHIQPHFFIPDHILHDIHRKAKGIIKLEDNIAGHLVVAAGSDISQGII